MGLSAVWLWQNITVLILNEFLKAFLLESDACKTVEYEKCLIEIQLTDVISGTFIVSDIQENPL